MAKYRLRDEVRSQCVEFTPSELRSKFRRIFGSEHPFFAGSESKDSTFRRFFKEGTGIGEENFLEFCRFINLMKGWDLRFGDYCFDERELEQLDPSYRIEQARFDLQPVNPVMVDGEGAAVFRRDFASLETRLVKALPPPEVKAGLPAIETIVRSTQLRDSASATAPAPNDAAADFPSSRTQPLRASLSRAQSHRFFSKTLLGAGSVGLLALAFIVLFVNGYLGSKPKSPLADPSLVVDVIQNEQLSIPLAEAQLPLISGDGIRLSISSQEPLYYYVVWFDAGGKVTPIWPWNDLQWESRPSSRDIPLQTLTIPEQESTTKDTFLKLTEDPDGLNAVFLIARRQPLLSDEELKLQLTGFTPNEASSPLYSNTVIKIDHKGIQKNQQRVPLGNNLLQVAKNPLSLLHSHILNRVDKYGDSANALCFPFGRVRNE